MSSSGGSSSRPILSLSTGPSPLSTPGLSSHSSSSTPSSGAPVPMPYPNTASSTRPPLLNAPSASQTPSRRNTPQLKLAMPIATSGRSMGADYPCERAERTEDDSPGSGLNTPTGEDMNPTLRAGASYGDGESAYGFGRPLNGLDNSGSEMSAMTAALRQVVSRSRYDASPSLSARSRASSVAGSVNSRRSSSAKDDLSALQNLRISSDEGGRRSMDSVEDGYTSEEIEPFDPSGLVFLHRLGEGTGGSVDLVKDPRTGRIMAKKVSPPVGLAKGNTDFRLSRGQPTPRCTSSFFAS